MTRKKFFLKFLVFFSSIAVVLGLLAGMFLPSDPQNYMAAWIDKIALLKNTPAPRILLVGGSNLTFGVDSALLSSATGLPVVNTSLHAGFGLDVTLNLVKPFIRKGDIILLVPEYEYFANTDVHTRGGIPTLAALLDAYPPAIFQFGTRQLDRFPEILSAVIRIRYDRYKALRMVNFDYERYDQEVRDPVYSRNNFNEYGDEIGQLNIESNLFPLNDLGYLGGKVGNERVITLLNNFGAYAQKRGASILYFFPYGREYNCDLSRVGLQKLYPFIVNNLSFTTISTPQNNCISNELFFDTNYHLTKTGRNLRSIRMVDELNRLIANGLVLELPPQKLYSRLVITNKQDDWTACLEKPSIFECENIIFDDGLFEFPKYGESTLENFTTQILYHLSDHQITILASFNGTGDYSGQNREYRLDFSRENDKWVIDWAGTRDR